MTSLQIVLATHQGARFLPAQLDSLFAQSESGFTLLVADDASTDGTQAILADYAGRYPGRVQILEFAAPAQGALANFARLIDRLDADYAMFCDQDDFWLPDKVALSLAAMRAAETRLSATTPILVHTDMVLTAADLTPVEPSFWRATRRDPTRDRLHQILVENSLAGCTLLINRPLYALARPIPPQATMHDHWLGLVAAAFGRIEYLAHPTLLYRRHGANSSRQPVWNPRFILSRAAALLTGSDRRAANEKFAALTHQAAVFLDRYDAVLTRAQRATIKALADLTSKPTAMRFWLIFHHRLTKSDWRRSLYMLVTIGRHHRRSNRRRKKDKDDDTMTATKKSTAPVSSIVEKPGPLVSVVIRNYNYSQFLRDAIDSALAQTYLRVEIIVVDDGSDDGSREILAEYGNACRVLLQSNRGETGALNNGFAIVGGDLVLFLDADDVLAPDAVASVVQAWAPDVTRISYPMRIMTENGHLLRACVPPGYDTKLAIEQQFARFGGAMSACQSANAYATTALLDVLPIDAATWPFPPDGYLNALTSVMGRVVLLADPQGGYRMHRSNFTLLNTLDGTKCAGIATLHVRLHETVRDFVGDERWQDFDPILPAFHWLHRLLSVCLAPQSHPFARDRRGMTLLRCLAATCRSGSAGWGRKLTLCTGAMMIVLLPQGLLRRALPGMLIAARVARYRGLYLQRWSRSRHWRQIYRLPR